MKLRNLLPIVLLGLAAFGHAELVVNGSFEIDTAPANHYLNPTLAVSGWNILPTGNVALIGTGYFGAPSQELDLSGFADVAGSGVSQSLSTIAGTTYKLSFDVFTWAGSGVTANVDGVDLFTNISSNTGRSTFSANFTSSISGSVLTLTSTGGNVSHIDNVSVVTAVPEPASIAAVSVGLVALRRLKRS